ncbi:hypothetical protein [Empedobacter sp.]|uniref:hypothetical protein n=1 Tax=Empedobacter sp. TaxID=1927715 RepID=UPI0028A71EDE|nr:hypothetical protein [Empedobacter sp.]
MSIVTQLNSKTWIVTKSKENLANYQTKLNSDSLLGVGSKKSERRPIARLRNREKEYKQFLKETFDNRKFISEKLLNKKLKERFGASTWYRKRMIGLELISVHNRIVKLKNSSQTDE